ncbi:MAG: PIN domain-containing protein [Candidatus Aenigmatarchaeota archaeon]
MNHILTVILDANFLMIPEQFGIDIFSELDSLIEKEYRTVTVDVVMSELRGLTRNSGKGGKAAGLALKLAEEKGIDIIETERLRGDDAILDAAKKMENASVATNDKELKKRCEEASIPVIYLRGNQLEATTRI